MADIFTDPGEREVLVHETATRRGLAPTVIEKDLWVCFTLAHLKTLAAMPAFTFKGGTSLSKVHGVIHRFSEDIDLTFSRDDWGFDGDRDPRKAPSKTQRKKLLDEIVKMSAEKVASVVVPGLRDVLQERLGDGAWSVTVDPDDGQTALFAYPFVVGEPSYLPPVVRMEFGARGKPWPVSTHVVRPYIEEEFEGTVSEAVVEVEVLDAARTFWEKATLLHSMYHVNLARPEKPITRGSRHVYDLHQMWGQPEMQEAIENSHDLLLAVVRDKRMYYADKKSRYELIPSGVLNARPHAELERLLRADHAAMNEMFFPEFEVPSFEDMLDTLGEVDALVSGWGPSEGSE